MSKYCSTAGSDPAYQVLPSTFAHCMRLKQFTNLPRPHNVLLGLFAWLAAAYPASAGEWEEYRNRLLEKPLPVVRQSFGYQKSRIAGGDRGGEIGGRVQRAITPCWYATHVVTNGLQGRLRASGKLAVRECQKSSGALIGWFNKNSRGWRTPNSLGMRVDGNGDKFWIFYEYGTRLGKTGGGATFEGERYQTTKTKPCPADGAPHRWALEYDPDGADGLGEITLTFDGVTYRTALAAGHKLDGATLDRFGIWNQQIYGKGLEMYVDDLEVDGRRWSFDEDPGWESAHSKETFTERYKRPLHDFGKIREACVGGIVWRTPEPAYSADEIGPLTPGQKLEASGTVEMLGASADSAVLLGWFDSRAAKSPASAGKPAHFIGILIEGPSRVGHYFRPQIARAPGMLEIVPTGPILRPDGKKHTFAFHYLPPANGARATLSYQLDTDRRSYELSAEAIPGSFDRFGLLAWFPADGHFVDIELDKLKYTR